MAELDKPGLPELVFFDISEEDQLSTSQQTSSVGQQVLRFDYIVRDNLATDTTTTSKKIQPIPPNMKPSDSSSSKFQFVNISGPAEMKDSKNKKLVRRSVAFNHRRKQVMRHSRGQSLGTSPHSCLDPNLSSQPPVNFCHVCGFSFRKKRDGLSAKPDEGEIDCGERECMEAGLLGAGRVDPFGTFPIASKPHMHLLVDHCKFGPQNTPIVY